MILQRSVATTPRRWHALTLFGALLAVGLCSCRASQHVPPPGPGDCPTGPMAGGMPMATGMPMPSPYPPGMEMGIPQPYQPCASWRPDGLPCPWPQDEYVCDGGDLQPPVGVAHDWEVNGLQSEDTVAHFDTLDGRTLVEPSNRVCIYAPRFGAVRQVVSLEAHERHDRAIGAHLPLKLTQYDDLSPPLTTKQHLQPQGEIAARPPIAMLGKQQQGMTSQALELRAFQDAFLPFENFAVIRMGVMEASEAAMLAKGVQAAVAWNQNQAVQVIVDEQAAVEMVRDEQAHETFTFKGEGHPKLRVIKVASTPFAEVGDTVDFTIRYDNVGTETVGNVTLLDSLSPRLELVEGSSQSSREGKFFSEPNQAGSVVVRFELTDPLPPDEGGIIRFTCRVR